MTTQDTGNPYQSPQFNVSSTRPLPAHRAALMFYWEHRYDPPTLGRFIVQYRRVWLLTVAISMIAFFLILLLTQDFPLALLASSIVLIASLARDLMHMRAAIRFWPVFSQVLAWDKVEAKLLERTVH